MVKLGPIGEAGGGGREPPHAKLTGLEFGTLDEEDLLKISVFETTHTIDNRKSLWDNRLGVFNLASSSSNHCFTCAAQRAEECDGHFGHIYLPLKIYHPLHIDFVKHILDGMCLVCHRIKRKEVVKKGNKEDETIWMDMKLNREVEIANEAPEQASIEESDYKGETENESQAEESSEKSDHKGEIENDAQAQESSEASNDVGCKYCGVNVKKEDRYPPLKLVMVKLSRKVGAKMLKTKHVTIKMVACAPEDKIPEDYWNFVGGHEGDRFDIRPLFPFEALKILKSLSDEAKSQLGMHSRLARLESLVIKMLPLPPSGTRIIEVYAGSSIKQVRTDDQYRFLLCLTNEIKRIRSEFSPEHKPTFEQVFQNVVQLQIIAADYLAGSKWEEGVKLKRHNPVKEETEKKDKFMKGHILAKANNASARMVVVGDPYIQLEEIALPLALVNTVTLPEKVTQFNMKWLQEVVNNGSHADLFRTGAVSVQRQGHGRNLLGFVWNKETGEKEKLKVTLQIGDTVHRHLQNGDLVILNRTPSLSKHSLMGLRVRLQLGTVMSINPLICASFQADFDGDAMHVYVPQSAEARAEVHRLLPLSEQLINSQRGQSNNGLTEDSRLGAYLLTSRHLFLNKKEMSHFLSSNSTQLPIPAIVKVKKLGPFWTGQQLYTTILPKGVNYRVAAKWIHRTVADGLFTTDLLQGVLIQDGELLVNDGQNSDWLGNTSRDLIASISKTHGSHVALAYLNRAQELANMYIQERGFSVGIEDFQLTSNRSHLSRVKLEKIERTNKQALMRTLIGDEHVQREELKKNPASAKGLSIGMECSRSKGLYLGTTELEKRVEPLDKLAIEWFQSRFVSITNRLAREFSRRHNSIFVMINANSKSMRSKVPQQVVSLGLQVYKGENLLPWSALDLAVQNRLTGVSSGKMVDLVQSHPVNTPGYWESRGIITSSYLDGLSAPQFYTHTISSRYGLMRAKVEQPNMLLRRLLLFLRDLHVGYDGSVRSLEGQQIIQYDYGGLLETEGEKTIVPTRYEAGEPVGVSAATATTEPLYQLKLDSPHMIGAKAMGPLELVNETINAPKAMKPIDRQILLKLRVPSKGTAMYAQEKSALRIKQFLKPVPLSMVASSTMIEYRALRLEGEDGRETAPWIGHIQLNSEKLALHEVSVEDILKILRKKYSSICVFPSSDRCLMQSPPASELGHEQCICFAMVDPNTSDDDQHQENRMLDLLEAMKDTILPTLLLTTIKGDERIESIHISWEEINWKPRSAKKASTASEQDIGELVVEVTVKKKYCKSDDLARAWNVVIEACHPFFHFIDWGRCIPYSIKAIRHVLGVEAANGVMLQRLELAFQGMGKDKEVNREHLKLIADSLTTSGEINGASLAGYKEYCKSFSRSTPFHNAATQDHKKSFLAAGREAAKETTDGALTSSVWGKAPGFGTGMFDLMWQPDKGVEVPMQKGIDIHECMTKLPPPTPRAAAEPNNGPPIPDRRGYRPRKSDWSNVVAPGPSRGITSRLAKKANGIRTDGKSSQPKVPGARGTPSEERSQENLDTIKEGKRPVLANRDSDPFAYRDFLKNQLQKLEKAPLKEKQRNDSCKKEQEEDSRIGLQLQQTSRREKLQQLSGTEQTKKKLKEAVELCSEDEDEDWENFQILARDVRDILHQKYKPGQTLNAKDRDIIRENVLEHHPDFAEKVGCGMKDIKVDYHKEHSENVCFYVIRQDGTDCDFSYRKCLQCYANGVSPTLARLFAALVKRNSR